MDLNYDVTYRGFVLNDADIQDSITSGGAIATGISGCQIDSVAMGDIDIVQFAEKRSQSDGVDVGDVFKGSRRIRMAGTLYARTRALLFDAKAELEAIFDPVLAQREEPADKGYRPLTFFRATNRQDDYPTGVIALQVRAMPRARDLTIFRTQQGGDDGDALALPWQGTFICKNPDIMGLDPVEVDLSGGGTVAGNLTNRGNALAPVDLIIGVGTAAGSIAVSAGDSIFTITVPASSNARTIRFKGEDKVLTVEELGVETDQYSLLTFSGSLTWPLIDPGVSAYSVTFTTVVPTAGSVLRFYERYS
jgi:hypothetical protein